MRKILMAGMMCLVAGCIYSPKVQTSTTVYAITQNGMETKLGNVVFSDTYQGLKVSVNLVGLPEGEHGFHVHENASCSAGDKEGEGQAGQGAGGHYDPNETGRHAGPSGLGHKGDLPKLVVGPDGTVRTTMYVPAVKAADFENRSLIIHAGSDTYSDYPEALGGGGARIACGTIE